MLCGAPHSCKWSQLRSKPRPRERHMRSTWAEGEAGAVGEGRGYRAPPHLPSGLPQRMEGALRGEPMQEALGQELCAIPWTVGGWEWAQAARHRPCEWNAAQFSAFFSEGSDREKAPEPQKASRPRGLGRIGCLLREASSRDSWRESAPSSLWETRSPRVLQVSAEFGKESRVCFRRSAPPRVF